MEWQTASNDQIDEAFDHFSGLSSAALAKVCDLIAVVDMRQSWMDDGSRNLTDWVSARIRIRHSTAARLVRVSRRLADLPVLAQAFAGGELSFDQVDAISTIATAETEEMLIGQAEGMTSAALDRLVRRERGLTREEARSVWERRKLVRQWNLDQSELKFRGRLPGDAGRAFDEAIDNRVDGLGPNPATGIFEPLETRSADALTELAATDGGGDGTPPQMTVFADFDTLTTNEEGFAFLDNTAPLPNETAQRLSCDATIETIVRDGERIIGIGRRSRKIPGWLRRLVYERDDSHCQHPGCRNTRWLQVHHIVPWARGGATDLDNLIVLCGIHHRLVHEDGWHITGPPGARVFRRPDWTPYPRPKRQLDPRLRELVRSR
jgi:hypothetical protein